MTNTQNQEKGIVSIDSSWESPPEYLPGWPPRSRDLARSRSVENPVKTASGNESGSAVFSGASNSHDKGEKRRNKDSPDPLDLCRQEGRMRSWAAPRVVPSATPAPVPKSLKRKILEKELQLQNLDSEILRLERVKEERPKKWEELLELEKGKRRRLRELREELEEE